MNTVDWPTSTLDWRYHTAATEQYHHCRWTDNAIYCTINIPETKCCLPHGIALNLTSKVFQYIFKWKKCSERCKDCVLAVVRQSQKIFATPQTPFPGAQDGQNLISWRWSLPSPTDQVWWRSMHAISYHGNRPTNNARLLQTRPITIHCTAKLSAQCKKLCAVSQ